MAQPNGDSHARRAQIRARLVEIHAELASLMRELEEGEDPEAARRRRKAEWRLLKGSGEFVLLALLLGVARAGEWTVRHARLVGAAVGTTTAAAVVAGALSTHSSPAPFRHRVTLPTAIATTRMSPAVPRPSRSRGVPVPPVVVPVRSRRPSPSAPAPTSPNPTPSRPTLIPSLKPVTLTLPPLVPWPAPTRSAPTPSLTTTPPQRCPVGLTLVLLPIGVTVCA